MFQATHDTWSSSLLGEQVNKLTSPTVNTNSGETILIEDDYGHRVLPHTQYATVCHFSTFLPLKPRHLSLSERNCRRAIVTITSRPTGKQARVSCQLAIKALSCLQLARRRMARTMTLRTLVSCRLKTRLASPGTLWEDKACPRSGTRRSTRRTPTLTRGRRRCARSGIKETKNVSFNVIIVRGRLGKCLH